MRTPSVPNLATVLLLLSAMSLSVRAQDVVKKLIADYPISVVNAEGGVVTQGVTLVLKQGMTAGAMTACTSDFKDGAIKLTKTGGANCADAAIRKVSRFIPVLPGVPAAPATGAQTTRVFVAGEKMYVTKIEVKDSVSFRLLSDAINEQTYMAEIHFPIAKGAAPNAAEIEKSVAELFTIAPPEKSADNAQGGQQAQAPAAAPARAAAPAAEPALAPIAPPPPPADAGGALAPIAPPPPPPDQPPASVALGMSPDQVIAILGQPATKANVGAKQIFSYKSLKVTFVNGKVTDVQ